MRRMALILLILCIALTGNAQLVGKIEPANWWAGMRTSTVELLVYGHDIRDSKVSLSPGRTKIVRVDNATSPNYLFVTLAVGDRPEALDMTFAKGDRKQTVPWQVLPRDNAPHKGFDSGDVIYLLMPDRFANGDVSNDSAPGMIEKADRNDPGGRHGGDIQGIIGHLDYLRDLGVTTLWSTPLWEANTPKNSYHGYASTDLYNIDPRYGSNDLYKRMVAECHKRGLKAIIDLVPNHCSVSHPWVKDRPEADWIHPAPAPGDSRTLAISAWTDPYVSKSDFTANKDGWFTPLMADLNQNDDHLLRYLTQNAIWWVEYAGLDGIRVDTYPYCEKSKIALWTKALTDEYPTINIVGECWQSQPSSVAYWQKDAYNKDGFNSCLPAVMDFPLMEAMQEAFAPGETAKKGMNKLYATLAQDYLYANPKNIMVFADNHDTERFASLIGKDPQLFKAAFGFLLTTRGIPQIYSGSEVFSNSDTEGIYTSNANRKDMLGGWPGDPRSQFTQEGRTEIENDIFSYLRTVLNWRKESSAVKYGKLLHFKPQDGTYVYFRYDDRQGVMVIVNPSEKDIDVPVQRYSEVLSGYTKGRDIVSGASVPLDKITARAKSTTIIELYK